MSIPFYQRALDSFSDEIITRTRQADDGQSWYAVLDTGFHTQVSDPDFSSAAATREDAVRACAARIRTDARGIGKYAPHALLEDGYDLHFRLAPHWADKELMKAAGKDVDAFVSEVSASVKTDPWKLQGGYLEWMQATRLMEARFHVGLLDAEVALAGGTSAVDAGQALLESLKTYVSTDLWFRIRPGKDTWTLAEKRIADHIAALDIAPVRGPGM